MQSQNPYGFPHDAIGLSVSGASEMLNDISSVLSQIQQWLATITQVLELLGGVISSLTTQEGGPDGTTAK